jgi:diguanylate cyclase (GGDEF)-like protein
MNDALIQCETSARTAMELSFQELPRRPKVLLVDDQPLHIQLIHQALAEVAQVFIGTSGEHGLKQAQVCEPDIILLDIEMPDLDGFAFLQRLRKHSPLRDVPVIFVTHQHSEVVETRCLAAGAVDFISKPFSPLVVLARTLTHLKLKFQADLLRAGAFEDDLTGLHNRRFLDVRLNEEWRRTVRQGHALSVLMIDVDFFKNYNDHYGHAGGDEVLRQVAEALRAQLRRPGDLVARYGGEEFMCVLPQTELASARLLAHRCLEAVRHLRLAHANRPEPAWVTISVGLAERTTISANALQDLIEAADQALYEAKGDGRDTVREARSWRDA